MLQLYNKYNEVIKIFPNTFNKYFFSVKTNKQNTIVEFTSRYNEGGIREGALLGNRVGYLGDEVAHIG